MEDLGLSLAPESTVMLASGFVNRRFCPCFGFVYLCSGANVVNYIILTLRGICTRHRGLWIRN